MPQSQGMPRLLCCTALLMAGATAQAQGTESFSVSGPVYYYLDLADGSVHRDYSFIATVSYDGSVPASEVYPPELQDPDDPASPPVLQKSAFEGSVLSIEYAIYDANGNVVATGVELGLDENLTELQQDLLEGDTIEEWVYWYGLEVDADSNTSAYVGFAGQDLVSSVSDYPFPPLDGGFDYGDVFLYRLDIASGTGFDAKGLVEVISPDYIAPPLPTTPEEPTDPEDPVDPSDPVDPVDPEDPQDPTQPTDPGDPTDPEDPADPEDPKDPKDPKDPDDPKDPVDPKDPQDPDEPKDPGTDHRADALRETIHCLANAGNHGQFVSCTARFLAALKRELKLDGWEKEKFKDIADYVKDARRKQPRARDEGKGRDEQHGHKPGKEQTRPAPEQGGKKHEDALKRDKDRDDDDRERRRGEDRDDDDRERQRDRDREDDRDEDDDRDDEDDREEADGSWWKRWTSWRAD